MLLSWSVPANFGEKKNIVEYNVDDASLSANRSKVARGGVCCAWFKRICMSRITASHIDGPTYEFQREAPKQFYMCQVFFVVFNYLIRCGSFEGLENVSIFFF